MGAAESVSSTNAEEVHAKKILEELWRQCESEEFCDVVLIAGTTEERIPAHSCILSAGSKYFKGILAPNTAKEVKISNVDGDVMQSLVKYCYTGRITTTEDNVVKLLKNANEVLLSDVLPACANLLVERLQPSNCLDYKLLGEQYYCETLLQKARDYSLEHFMEVQELAEFLKINANQLKELLESDNLNVCSEENVFNSLLAWIRHDPIKREKYQAELLKLVRLPLLGKSFLIEHVKPICTSTECREIYMEAIEQKLTPSYVKSNVRKSVKSKQFLMGITLERPKLHLGVGINEPKIKIHYYCTQRLQWMNWSKGLKYCDSFDVAVTDDTLFLAGGRQSVNNPLNTVVCLNLKTMTLTEVAPMTVHRRYFATAVLNGFLYVVGGENIDGCLNSVEKWNPTTNIWSTVASMQICRSAFKVAVLNEKLYAVGGNDCAAECYEPQQNKWFSIASMNHARHGFGLVVSNGLLYAVSGLNGIKSVERYNPEFDCWTLLSNINDNLVDSMSCTSFRNKVIVCYKDRVEEYHEETDEWKTNATLKALHCNHGIFTYSGELLTSEFAET